MNQELMIKYGMNPHQKNAKLFASQKLPFKILNGDPSYINFLDALNSFQLVKELTYATGLPAAASFKHVSPAGAAVYTPMSEYLAKAYFVEHLHLSPLAIAYVRARGTDRISSFGDCAAFSENVDVSVANVLKNEVSDIIVAPSYDNAALEILKKKKKGKYLIIQIDADYIPDKQEQRSVFGITLEQERNDIVIDQNILNKIVTNEKHLPDSAKRDLLVATITLKYTQSNSVCFAKDGQTIGVGAGQQSRVHCTKLAASKADNWYLRQHPLALELKFVPSLSKVDRSIAIDKWVENELTPIEELDWSESFQVVPPRLNLEEKRTWIKTLDNVSFSSDAFIPFRDNIDRASQSGVKYIVQSGGSARDEDVIQAANDYKMVMAFSNIRLFHH